MYGVTSVLYAELSVTAEPQATVNSASTELTVEVSLVDSGTDNNMFGVNSFVELGDTDMRISVGGPMSDWKNEGLRVIDGATCFGHPDGTTFFLCATGIASSCPTTLWCTNQLRASGSEVNDITAVHGGKSNIITPCNINLPLEYRSGLDTTHQKTYCCGS